MRSQKLSIASIFYSVPLAVAGIVCGLAAMASPARAQNATTISLLPPLTTYVNLVPGPSGRFYGVTSEGNIGHCVLGCGTVFELSRSSGGSWTQTSLYTFDGTSGAWPQSGLVLDKAGNLYGATYYGGATYGSGCISDGCGAVFRLSRSGSGWVETVLYSFSGGSDGSNPTSLAFDASGDLVGTARYGGSTAQCSSGCGVIFQLARDSGGAWHESTLLEFPGGSSGEGPLGLSSDAYGNFYGTAGGGKNTCYAGYCGIVFKLTHSSAGWKESVVHQFHGSDGELPNPSLIFDYAGNIYGSTFEGGTGCKSVAGCGAVFQLTLNSGVWHEVAIHNFTDQADGYSPLDGLVFDAQGNLYGGTQFGGFLPGCNEFLIGACGQIFKLSQNAGAWSITAEYPTPGWIAPVGDLAVDKSGTVYGSACDLTYLAGCAIFEILP
jgi:hypothetical protein